MKNALKKLFGQRGFSLPEILIGVGLMGGMSLLVTQVVKQTDQVKKSSETNSNTFAAIYEIQEIFKDKDACALNLQGKMGGSAILTVVNKKNILRYEVGKVYDNGSIRLTELTLSRNGDETSINVAIEKFGNKKANGLNNTVIKKSIPINAEYDGSGNLLSCQSDVVNHVSAAVNNALTKICSGMNLSYDSTTKRCLTIPQIGENSILACPNNQSLISFQLDNGKYITECKDTVGMQGACNDNQLLRRNADKSFTCVDISCPGAGMFLGLNSNGTPNCLTCTAGTFPVFAGGSLQCKRPACPNSSGGSGQLYMVRIDSNGDPICNNLIDSTASTCSSGKLAVRADGSLAFDCCTANCSDAPNQCSGSSFPSSNGCGQCAGTKAANCSDSSNHCSGTSYASTDGCGLCSGTRLATNATWSDWTPCTNGTRSRTCSNDQACGGASCIGDAMEACGSTSWQCQRADIQLMPNETKYWNAANVRMDPMDWQQIRPNWPIIKTPGNSWQQGNHPWCVNECAAKAENLYAASITQSGGKTVMLDSSMAISIGVADIFFQENSNYNQGVPNDSNDNSGWWCACYMKLHPKATALTFTSHMIQKSDVDAQRENASFCTVNGTMPAGGTSAPPPGPGPAKVDGGWSAWGVWQGCSNGTQYRTRSCTNPAPSGYGADCVGSTSESRSCSSPDTCNTATCSTGTKYIFQNSQDFMKACQMSGANCQSSSIGSTCYHQGKSPYIMCVNTYPGNAGGLTQCTYSGLSYWTSVGCNNW